MPEYTVTHPNSLSFEQRKAIAGEITRHHHEIAKSKVNDIRVVFHDSSKDEEWKGGEPSPGEIRITGRIGDGRTREVKRELVQAIGEAVEKITGPNSIPWVWLREGERAAYWPYITA